MQLLVLHGIPARRHEPKRLRLRLAVRWPWAGQLVAAIIRLQALPIPTWPALNRLYQMERTLLGPVELCPPGTAVDSTG